MKPISTSADLKNAIAELKLEQQRSFAAMKEEFSRAQDNLKLANILKTTFKNIVDVPDLKKDIFNAAIGVASGVMAKKLVAGKTRNPLSKLAGMAMEMLVANKVTQNADLIRSAGGMILNKLFKKKEQPEKVL